MEGELKMKDEIVETRIGIYDVIYESDYKSNDGHKLYHVKCCECGYETDMQLRHIRRASKCTHINKNGTTKLFNAYTWGNNRICRIFRDMIQRCYNEHEKSYRWYGAKGIKICDEWMNNPKSFEEWALNNGYEDNLTIDRIKEDKSYCPENCRWITGEDNAKYKSTTSLIEVNGEVNTGQGWAKELGFGQNRINTYIREYGEENTKEFIRRYLEHPDIKPRGKQSYYDLYMNDDSISL